MSTIAPWQILYSLIRSLGISFIRNLPVQPFLVCACLKVVLDTLTAKQIQHLAAPTRKTYEKWIEKAINSRSRPFILKHDIEPLLDSGSSLLWVGDRQQAKTVVLFLHGGGYMAPLLPGHLEWCSRVFLTAGKEAGTGIAVAVLEYTLCPEAQYPTQLRQAVNGLSHLLQSGRCLEDIFICGDSAGGNLAAQLAMHLCCPNPLVQRITAQGRLGGVCLISPWLSMKTNDKSFITNASIDMLSAETVSKASRYLFGNYTTTNHGKDGFLKLAFPLDMEYSNIEKLSHVVSHMYITVGDHEVLRDQVVRTALRIQDANSELSLTFELQKMMAHDFILLEGQRGQNGKCIVHMKRWILDALSADKIALSITSKRAAYKL